MFAVETIYDLDALTELNLIAGKTLGRVRGWLMALGLSAALILLFGGAAFMAQKNSGDPFSFQEQGGIFLLAVFPILSHLFAARTMARKQARQVFRSMGRTPVAIRLEFEATQLYAITDGRQEPVPYRDILAVFESKTHFFLAKTDRRQGFIFRKDQLVQGDPEEFRAFLTRQLGQEIRFVKT